VEIRLPRPDGQIETLLRNAFQAVARTMFYRHVPPPRFAAESALVSHPAVGPQQ
jgi:hypothetical protein